MEINLEPDIDIDDPEPINLPGPSSAQNVALGLGRTKRPAATIWKYFEKTSQNEGKCMICKHLFKLKTGTTSPMIRHLQGKHPATYKQYSIEYSENEAKKTAKQAKLTGFFKQPKIDDVLTAGEKWSNSHPKSKTITTAITTWMAKSIHPYSLVEEEGFIKLMNVTEPKYVVPSRTLFSRKLIPELYENIKGKVISEIGDSLKEGISSFSISTDLWTSSANDSFLSVNAHFLNKNFELRPLCLANAHFEEEHTGRNISSKLREIVEKQYGIKPSNTVPIFCITDNATNMVSALTLMAEWNHLRCFAHTLQLALNDAKKDVAGMARMLSKARSIVGHYKHSSTAQTRLDKIQQKLGMQPLHLVQDCETRWNSEFNMLTRLLELKQPLSADLVNISTIDNLTSNEWELAEGYTVILKPLDSATKMASSSSLPTLSSVLPIIDGLQAVLKNYINSGNKGVMFARALEKSVKTRFPESLYLMNKHYYLAMTLDPRYKTVVLEEANKKTVVEVLKREALQFHKNLKQASASTRPTSTVTSEGESSGEQTDNQESFSLWHNFQQRVGREFKEQSSEREQSSEDKHVSNQIDAYLSVPTIGLQEDPCKWWKENCSIYTYLAPIAKIYLGIPATEVESERVFSSAGNVVSERRRSLKQEHISELVFLHHNL